MRIAVWIAVLVACTQPRSKECKDVCSREAECVTKANAAVPFDEKECVAACAALDNDPDNRAKVKKHYECVQRANASCADVLACE